MPRTIAGETSAGVQVPLRVNTSGQIETASTSATAATIAGPLDRKADAASVSVALSIEDVALLTALLTASDFDTKIGALTETAPGTDTASSGLNGRMQRVAQRLTSLIALLPTALGAGGGLKVDGSGTALPTSGTRKARYGTSNQAFTLTIASLANNGAQASTAIDNTTNLFEDALVQLKIKSPASSTAATGYVNVYAYGTADGGTTYSDGATGTNASITLTIPTNARLIGAINIVANATTYYSAPMSVAAAFGGILPDHWGIIIENKTGGTLDTTAGNHAAFYQGVQGQFA